MEQDHFLESMAEAAKVVTTHCGENILYISVMNRLSVDCDCDSNPEEPKMADIGMLASLDPVALDKACVDLVYASPDPGRVHLIAWNPAMASISSSMRRRWVWEASGMIWSPWTINNIVN